MCVCVCVLSFPVVRCVVPSVDGQGDASARMAAGRTMMAEQGDDGRFKVKDVVEVSVPPLSLVASKSVHLARRGKKHRCCWLYQGFNSRKF